MKIRTREVTTTGRRTERRKDGQGCDNNEAATATATANIPSSRDAVLEVERRLQAACVAVRVCLETHVAREEAELWPLFEKHFTATEQGRLVGLIIGRTGARGVAVDVELATRR